MIKIIAFDMDDTLLNSKRKINKEDLIILKDLISKGIKIVFSSGRPYSKTIDKYYKKLGIKEGYYVAFNGEAIYDISTHKCIYNDYLDNSDINYIIDNTSFINEYDNLSTYIYKDVNHNRYSSFVYATLANQYTHIEDNNNHIKIKLVNDLRGFDNAHKYMIATDPDKIKEIYKRIPKDLLDKYSICTSMPCFIEFFKEGNNKSNGLLQVCKLLNIDIDNVMAFGDSMNDYEMVTKSRIGIAMGNSVDKLKEEATYVTLDNDSCGIKEALIHFKKEFE